MFSRFLLALALLAAVPLAGCFEPRTGARAPTPPVAVPGDLRFLLNATYAVGGNLTLRLENHGNVTYRYSFVEAFDINFTDSGGRSFRPPQATPPTVQNGEKLAPGGTQIVLFWDGLRECTENGGFRGACTESRPLDPGVYFLSRWYPDEDAWERRVPWRGVWANASFQIA